MKQGEVYKEVQAALLNSSGDPGDEIESALYAVIEFAILECEAASDTLQALVSSITERVERTTKQESRS